jgi:hypothetical protein
MNTNLKITKIALDKFGRKTILDAIGNINLQPLKSDNVPLGQGMAIKTIAQEFRIPLHKLTRADLFGQIKQFGLYAIEIAYKNGIGTFFICDKGSYIFVVATMFLEAKKQSESLLEALQAKDSQAVHDIEAKAASGEVVRLI